MTEDRPRTYRKRTPEERIADLEAQIEAQKQRLAQRARRAAKKVELPPSIKRIPALAKRLRTFAELAEKDGRADVSNSVSMFVAGLERIHAEESAKRSAPADLEPTPQESAGEGRAEAEPDDSNQEADAERGRSAGATSSDALTPARRRSAGVRQRATTEAERLFDERLRSITRADVGEAPDGPSRGSSR